MTWCAGQHQQTGSGVHDSADADGCKATSQGSFLFTSVTRTMRKEIRYR